MTQNFINKISNVLNTLNISSISTYGAIIIPFDTTIADEQAKVETNPKDKTSQMGKIKSALKIDNQTNVLQEAIKEAISIEEKEELQQKLSTWTTFKEEIGRNKNVKVLSEYMQDKKNMDKLGSAFGVIGSKFSGIAVAQALIDGKVTSQEALDYLFMGFAPALGVQGSLMGYSGLNQLKDAFSNGSVNVGSAISGFRKVLKGATDLKNMLTRKDTKNNANIVEIDLTLSHSETYQSETPDRRVQSGQSLNEYVHNMPDTFQVQCALQEGKRYSIPEFRAILKQVQLKKQVVQLVLGQELFDNLILTDFNPINDCSKSGMDYTLSFKKITRSDIDTTAEVTIQQAPELVQDKDKITSSGGLSSGSSKDTSSTKFNIKDVEKEIGITVTPQKDADGSIRSMANMSMGESGNY